MLILGGYLGLIQLVGTAKESHTAMHLQPHQHRQPEHRLAWLSKTVLYMLTKVPQSHQANQLLKHMLIL